MGGLTNLLWLVLVVILIIRLVQYEVMVRVLIRWIQYIDLMPNDAQIDYLAKDEFRKLFTGALRKKDI